MKKRKAIIYGCGDFYKKMKDKVSDEFEIVGIVDKHKSEAKCRNLADIKNDYECIVVMISNINIIFEVLNEFADLGVDFEQVILAVGKYGLFSECVDISITLEGKIILSTSTDTRIVNDESGFWEFIHENCILYLEEKSRIYETKLLEIHRQIFELTWGGGSRLSYNHDNDLFYRLPETGEFGFGLIASVSLCAIRQFNSPYVLDLGCGDGFYYRRFYNHISNLRYVGCDLDLKSLERAKKAIKNDDKVKFLEKDFCCDMPFPEDGKYFTNVFWYASMQMFDEEKQRIILENIRVRIGEKGILSGTACIKNNSWEYCKNYFDGTKELKKFLQQFFENVYVYTDEGMGDFAIFVASQNSKLYLEEI